MYNLLIAGALAIVAFAATVLVGFAWYAGLAPAVAVFVVALLLLVRRTARQLQQAMVPIHELMSRLPQMRSRTEANAGLDEVRAGFARLRDTFGPWQLLLTGQLDAQIGALDYLQGRYDEALPKLQKAWRDPFSKSFEACIHARQGRPEQAWAAFEVAAGYAPKEPTVYLVWGLLASRRGQADQALHAFGRGLAALPDHPELKRLRAAVANKRPVDPNEHGEVWWRFFPEDAAERQTREALVRGRRDKGPLDGHTLPGQTPPTLPRGRAARR